MIIKWASFLNTVTVYIRLCHVNVDGDDIYLVQSANLLPRNDSHG